jgi:hypothetical protein
MSSSVFLSLSLQDSGIGIVASILVLTIGDAPPNSLLDSKESNYVKEWK